MPSRIEAVVREFLRNELALDDGAITTDTALVTSGLLDSAGVVRLAAVLERATGIIIPDRDVRREHFDSIARIAAYLASRGVADAV